MKNGLPPMINVMLIASAKSLSARGAYHHPAFMSGCLTISDTSLPCQPSERTLPFWKHWSLGGR